VKRAVLGIALALALALAASGCGATSSATITPGTPLTATSHPGPQLAIVRLRTFASGPGLNDLVLAAIGNKHDVVLSAGSRRTRFQPTNGPVAWSPNGKQVAFARFTSGALHDAHGYPYIHTDVFVVNVNGSGLRRLTRTNDAVEPVWSPDGSEIVFARDHLYVSSAKQTEGLTGSMWTVRPNGTGLRQLTAAVAGQDDVPGSFSPDGRLLAFTRVVAPPAVGIIKGNESVDLLDVSHGTVRRLAGQASDPSFAPDGRTIATTSTRDHNGTRQVGEDSTAYAGDLYLVDLSGRHWLRLTATHNIDEAYPTFSPDGQRVAFQITEDLNTSHSYDSYHDAIAEVNLDGSCRTTIRDDRSDILEYSTPAWRPGASQTDMGPLKCSHR
jgi:Tol biopolymer transport system component